MSNTSIVQMPAGDGEVSTLNPERARDAAANLLRDEAYVDLAETFRALADSTRAKIVHLLSHESLCTRDLAQVIGMSEPAVSQHMRLLRSLRIVRGRRSGKNVYYSLEDAHVRALLGLALDHSSEPVAGTRLSS